MRQLKFSHLETETVKEVEAANSYARLSTEIAEVIQDVQFDVIAAAADLGFLYVAVKGYHPDTASCTERAFQISRTGNDTRDVATLQQFVTETFETEFHRENQAVATSAR